MFVFPSILALAGDPVFGKVDAPVGVDKYNAAAGAAANNIGLILFISNLIKVATIVAGVIVLFNLIAAGYIYINSQGDTNAANKVKDQITTSVLGLIVIVASYTIVAVVSFFLFGDAGYILNPTLPTP